MKAGYSLRGHAGTNGAQQETSCTCGLTALRERARAILSAQPETCVALFYNAPCGQELDGNRHVTCANRIEGLHAPRIGCHEFVPPVSQPSTTEEKS